MPEQNFFKDKQEKSVFYLLFLYAHKSCRVNLIQAVRVFWLLSYWCWLLSCCVMIITYKFDNYYKTEFWLSCEA